MESEKHPGEGSGHQAYDKSYFMKKFAISEAEVQMALAEIHYTSAEELDDYLQVKYRKSHSGN